MPAPVMNDLARLGARLHLRWLLAPLGVLVAAAVSLVILGIPIWLAWFTTDHGTNGIDQLFTLIGSAWLAAQAVPLHSAATYSILPWGLAIIPIVLLYRAGVVLGRATRKASLREIGILLGVAALTYAGVMALVAWWSATHTMHASVPRAALTGLLIALVTMKIALLRSTDAGRLALAHVPRPVWTILRAAAAGILALLGAAAVLALISLVWHFSQAKGIFEFLGAGVWGGLVITLGCIGYLPVLVLWALAYLLGPGIAIGPGIGLSPFVPAPPPTVLPGFPLVAALPERVGAIAWGLPIIAVVIGAGIGIMVARSGERQALVRLGYATAATVLTGLGVGLLACLSFGSLGDVRLQAIGPDPVLVALLAFGLTAIGAIPTALALRVDREPAEQDEPTVDLVPEPPTADDAGPAIAVPAAMEPAPEPQPDVAEPGTPAAESALLTQPIRREDLDDHPQ
ncbi:MAG: DUF6350 family protein [Candidatus Nanopelagicales bacterium]|nr:DUF6350 family protein [Candidatus Nanopelagicales bacterium]